MDKTFAIVGTAPATWPVSSNCPLLSKSLTDMGYLEVGPADASYLIAINHDSSKYRDFMRVGGTPQNAALIRVEPLAVHPTQYQREVEELYEIIFTPGAAISKSDSKGFLGWPYEIQKNPAKPTLAPQNLDTFLRSDDFLTNFTLENWKKRKNRFHLIAANKVSPTKESNYQLRRDFAAATSRDILDVFGPLWNSHLYSKIRHRLAITKFALKNNSSLSFSSIFGSIFKKYLTFKGEVENKYTTSQNYRYSLVIENSNDYASEKLIDAMLAGCICVYAGPGFEEVGFPLDVAIQYSGDPQQLEAIISNMTAEVAEGYLTAMRNFLTSQYFRENWSADMVFNKIAMRLNLAWGLN